MASFDENGKYIKTNWKAGDKITATKLNKIEESIEAVNENDISRYDEMRDKFIILEAKDAEHDKELANVKNTITDNKNNVEQVMAKVDEDINAFKDEFDTEVTRLDAVDEELRNNVLNIKNDIQYPMNLAGEVKNAYKFELDHDGMMSSLVTLNNIEGLSSVDTNGAQEPLLVSRYLKNICTVNDSKNYFEDATFSKSICNGNYTQNGTTINVTGSDELNFWSCVDFELPTLVEGKKYCILCDNVIVDSGGSAIELRYYTNDSKYNYPANDNLQMCVHSQRLDESGFNMIFTHTNLLPYLRLHCSLDNPSGDVTYENIQIYEVKEMIVPDIYLNSLPNGVKDEIKDGMLIKRTKRVNLAELTWIPSSTNPQFPQSDFVVYYTHSTPDFIVETPTLANELGHILCNHIPCVSNDVTASAEPSAAENNRLGISGHREWSEIRIKVPRYNVPDLESLYAWLASDNVHAVYQLETPEYIPFGLTIKADKGDTVVINTTKTMDLTYDIQLNTRAQIDALQESANRTDIISNELNELIKNVGWEFVTRDVQEGSSAYKTFYYMLPGGLMIQGGRAVQQAGVNSVRIVYPKTFTECITTSATGQWTNGNDHYWVIGNTDRKTFCQFVKNGDTSKSDELYWIAIGY